MKYPLIVGLVVVLSAVGGRAYSLETQVPAGLTSTPKDVSRVYIASLRSDPSTAGTREERVIVGYMRQAMGRFALPPASAKDYIVTWARQQTSRCNYVASKMTAASATEVLGIGQNNPWDAFERNCNDWVQESLTSAGATNPELNAAYAASSKVPAVE